MSNLPVDPYDRTVIVEPAVDNPDRAPLSGTGRDIVVTLWPADKPGRTMAFLSAAGTWVPFTTTEFTSWGGIIGNIEDQADLMAMFAEYSKTTEFATVAFTGNYNDLTNKPPLGTVSPLDLNGSSQQFLRGDGIWAEPVDIHAVWGQIAGNITDQNDLMALFATKAPINNPTFTGLVNFPTPPVDDNSTRGATTAWYHGQAFNGVPSMDTDPGVSGASLRWARGDHRHPSDTTRAALAGATFTGAVNVPNVAFPNDTTLAANTHYVTQAIAASGGVVPPPSDGNTYGYKNGAWVILDLATKWDKAS